MPLYEYLCSHCGKQFEIQHKMADPTPTSGPNCQDQGCKLERQISRVSAVVKSPNPFAAAAGRMPGFESNPAKSDTNTEQKSHQCGSGCALHSH